MFVLTVTGSYVGLQSAEKAAMSYRLIARLLLLLLLLLNTLITADNHAMC
jgi:hypothetical protein